MFCAKCGALLNDNAMFCDQCGTPTPQPDPSGEKPKYGTTPPYRQYGQNTNNGGKKAYDRFVAVLLIIAVLAAGNVYFAFFHTPQDAQKSGKTRKDRTESQQESASSSQSASAKLFLEYLDNTLAAQYGYADLEKQTKFISYSDTNFDNEWTGIAGIAGFEILDLDGDGDDEMAAAVLEAGNIIISIYEVESGNVVKKAEISEERFGDMFAYSEILTIVDGKDGIYLLFSQDLSGLVSDGYYSQINLYRYDGENLGMPLTIAQDGGGSSNFVYNAYKYQSDGTMLSQETVYDETYGNNQTYGLQHFISRVEELFGEYGITPADNAFRKCESICGVLAAFNSSRPVLMQLDMWGDRRDDYVVYHFNDQDSPILTYKKFLRNEETLRIRNDALYTTEIRNSWSMDELFADIDAQSKERAYDNNSNGVYSVEYAILDCGGDGFEEMAIRFIGMNTYSLNDDSDLTVIVTCKNGYLELVSSFETWARSFTTINYDGIISSGGSGGAGDHYFSKTYMDADYNVQDVYSGELLDGWWTSYVSESAYNAAFANTEPSFRVTIYTIRDLKYYTVDPDPADAARCDKFVSLCKQEGKNFVTEDKIDALKEQRQIKLGIDRLPEDNPLSWNGWYW